MDIDGLLNRTLLLDLETTLSGKIRHIGAVFHGHRLEKTKLAGSKAVFSQALLILSHNQALVNSASIRTARRDNFRD